MICARTLFVSGPRLSALGSDERELVETLDAIALSGHSGDRLPIAAEWRAYLATGRSGVLVADGAESEPASAMETALMQLRPHLVLDGLACAAEAVGARDAVRWLPGTAHPARPAMMSAFGRESRSRTGRTAYAPCH